MIKVCIIEDEPEIRKLLRKIIERQEGFQVVSESGDFVTAISEFSKYQPDVAFVDIDLGGDNGLECAHVMTELNPKLKVIFATAHSEYMANAFEIYAFDYLVKPFDVARVAKTLARIKETNDVDMTENVDEVTKSELYSDKLMLKGKDQVSFIDTKEIIFVERMENATRIVTKDDEFKTTVSLSGIEEKLNPSEFMRCHKSYIINLSMISRLEPYGRWTYIVKMRGTKETALMTAQNYEEVKRKFK